MPLDDAPDVGRCLADVLRDDDARAQTRRLRGLGTGAGRRWLRCDAMRCDARRGEARAEGTDEVHLPGL
jgi:hypothetical protein